MKARDRKALRFGVGYLVALMVVKLVAVPAFQSYRGTRQQLDAERRMLAAEIGLLQWTAESRAVTDSLAKQTAAALTRAFDGLDVNLIAGDVERYIASLAADASVAVSSLTVSVDSTRSGVLRPLTVKLGGETDYEGLLSLLSSLEQDAHAFGVQSLDVRTVETDAGVQGFQRLQLSMRVGAQAMNPSRSAGR